MDVSRKKNFPSIVLSVIYVVFVLSECIWCQVDPKNLNSLNTRELFESRLLQLEFLSEKINFASDSLAVYLREEINYFTESEEWETALALIDQLITYYQEQNQIFENPPDFGQSDSFINAEIPQLYTSPERLQWTLETGTDYSRQEFEMSFIETDSVIIEELNNPFFAFRVSKSGYLNKKNYQVFQYLRSDEDLLQTTTSFSLESTDYKNYWRIESLSDFFWQYQQDKGNFWENQIIGILNKSFSNQDRIYIYSQLRYKIYFNPDSSFGQLFATETSGSFRHFFELMSWFEISARSTLYNENQHLGLHYGQIHSKSEISVRSDYNRLFLVQANHYYRSFRSRLTDGDYRNSYNQFQPIMEGEIPIFTPFGISGRAELQIRRYSQPDVSRSNFNFSSLEGRLKFYLDESTSIGLGYIYETENHRSTIDSEKTLVEQENFFARGLSFSADILRENGLLLTLLYQFTLRDYPNAESSDLLGYFSNRKIHSLTGICYIPISLHWQFQLLANYDNDRDRDREANDNFSTIFNIGFAYKF
jgi:hypothetical protein